MRLQRRCARMALSTATFAALSLGDRKVLVGRHAVAQAGRDRHEVARASELLRAEAFGHLAHELRDVSLLGCLMRILLAPSALNLAAAARPRSGSGSSLTTSQRYWLWDPQRWLRPIWLQPARASSFRGPQYHRHGQTGASTSPTFLCIDRSSGVVRGLAIASVDRLHCDKSEVAADARRDDARDSRRGSRTGSD
jgi:hypothetical protein